MAMAAVITGRFMGKGAAAFGIAQTTVVFALSSWQADSRAQQVAIA
jgi:uncharacterized membrane protein